MLKQFGHCPFSTERASPDVVAGHRIEGIDNRQNAGANRKMFARDSAVAVLRAELSRCVTHDVQQAVRSRAGGKNADAMLAIAMHQFHFFRFQPGRLLQNVVGDADLADIVQ